MKPSLFYIAYFFNGFAKSKLGIFEGGQVFLQNRFERGAVWPVGEGSLVISYRSILKVLY